MKWPDGKPYYSLNQYYNELFGRKTYKIALDIDVTCPNRDGTLDTRGCLFCSDSGSGDFAINRSNHRSITEQIDSAIELLQNKHTGSSYVAYLQSFTNTYGDYTYLKNTYMEIIQDPRICGLSIGTRPDCLSEDILTLLSELNLIKPVFVELGLQTIHAATAQYIRRCYPLSVFDHAVLALKSLHIPVIVHLIVGLPGEDYDAFMESVSYLAKSQVNGVKLQLLHVTLDSDLGRLYQSRPFELLTLEGYSQRIVDAIALLPPEIVIHRITGDGNKATLIAPLWSLNKRNVLNTVHKRFATEDKWQGCLIK